MTWVEALVQLKAGTRVRRAAWDAPDQFVGYMAALTIPANYVEQRTRALAPPGDLLVQPHFVSCGAAGGWVPGWTPTTEDPLADDWEVFTPS